jgi:hypothetical protein
VLPLSNPRQPFPAALTAIWCGAFLVLTLCWATGAAEAHPGMRIPIEDPVVLDAPSTAPPPLVETRPVPLRPDLKESPQAATPSTAWIWVALLALPAAAAVARQHWPRALVLALVLLLAILACESAIHSVHHLKDLRHAEACPVFSASQHVTGLTAFAATPDLPPPPATPCRLSTRTVHVLFRAVDGEQSRAPPARFA